MAPAGFGSRVEGLHAAVAAAEAGRVAQLRIETRRLRRREYEQLAETVRAGGGRIIEVDDIRSEAETSAPQGVVAECRPIREATIEGLAGLVTPSAVLILDHVLDPQNVGAIARSVAGAGLGGLVVARERAAPLSAAAFKAAAGTLEQLGVARVASIAGALARLQRLGLWGVGLAAEAKEVLFEQPLLREPVALVVGEEGKGLSRLVRDRLDLEVRIPLAPGVESLNVSVASALAVFEVARLRR